MSIKPTIGKMHGVGFFWFIQLKSGDFVSNEIRQTGILLSFLALALIKTHNFYSIIFKIIKSKCADHYLSTAESRTQWNLFVNIKSGIPTRRFRVAWKHTILCTKTERVFPPNMPHRSSTRADMDLLFWMSSCSRNAKFTPSS